MQFKRREFITLLGGAAARRERQTAAMRRIRRYGM
jgi:hypothetical protein